MKAKYIGSNNLMGLKKGHYYDIEITKKIKSYVYDIYISDIDKIMNCASQISIKHYWDIKDIKLNDD